MKNLLSLAFFILCILTATAQIPTDGLVGSWIFSGNANDVSGNNLNGTVVNATLTTDRFGNPNSAYYFNGTNAQIVINGFANTLPHSSISVSVWALSDTSMIQSLFQDAGGSSSNRIVAHLHYQSLQNTYWDYGNTTTGRLNCNISSTQLRVWEHYVFIADSITHKLEIYKNGNLVCSNNSANAHFVNTNQNFWIGGGQGAIPFFFKGKIDDFRMYNRVLNQNEINALFNDGICYQTISVTDTLIINTLLTGFNPVKYQNTIKIWPNPTNNHITIDNGNLASMIGFKIKIINSLNQQVFQSEINQQQFNIDLSSWTGNGTYYVQIIDAQNNIIDIRKIILQ